VKERGRKKLKATGYKVLSSIRFHLMQLCKSGKKKNREIRRISRTCLYYFGS